MSRVESKATFREQKNGARKTFRPRKEENEADGGAVRYTFSHDLEPAPKKSFPYKKKSLFNFSGSPVNGLYDRGRTKSLGELVRNSKLYSNACTSQRTG